MKSVHDLAIDIRAIARDYGMLDTEGKFLGELIDYLGEELDEELDEARELPKPMYSVWFKAPGRRPEQVTKLRVRDAQAAIAFGRAHMRMSKFAVGHMHAFRDGSREEKVWLARCDAEMYGEIVRRPQRREIPRPSKPDGMRWYEIWVEGYLATGDRAPAHLIGQYRARSFDDAVTFAAKDKSFRVSMRDGVWHEGFGCRLFDNEADARRAFG